MARQHVEQVKLLEARLLLLTDVQRDPKEFLSDSKIIAALTSQNRFAALRWEPREIRPIALNTLKKYADANLAQGHGAINLARLRALKSIEVAQNAAPLESGTRTKRVLENLLKQAKEERLGLREELVLLTMCLKRSLELWKGYVEASGTPTEKARCRKEQSEILACFSHASVAADHIRIQGNVIKL